MAEDFHFLSLYNPIIATLSNQPGLSPSRHSTPTTHVAPSGSALPCNATHTSTSSFLSTSPSSSGLTALKLPEMIPPLRHKTYNWHTLLTKSHFTRYKYRPT